jgi:PhnB protein
MKASTTLHFSGQCEAAFKHYERQLGAKIEFMLKWGESPAGGEVPPEWRDKVLHARMTLGGADIVAGDVLARDYRQPQGFSVMLAVDDRQNAEQIFAALADGGSIKMPLQKTFWAPLYGVVVDRYAIPWEVNCEAR